MSQQLISRNSDLKRLRDEGYDLEVRSSYLILKNVPYVNSKREVSRGILVSSLSVAGEEVLKPDTHVAYFAGEYPHHANGNPIKEIEHQAVNQEMGGVLVNFSFSAKPPEGYSDYYAKMSQYASILGGPANALDPEATPKIFPLIETTDDESTVFNYLDTASSRAGIEHLNKKLEIGRVAIIGLGGTGSYILDLVAKLPISEIHLFDKDQFVNHNAFRSPGAPTKELLSSRPAKVHYFTDIYSRMHKSIIPHNVHVTHENVDDLRAMSFVFVCIDSSVAKQPIVNSLRDFGIPFIDVGMGIQLINESLLGIVRTTTYTNVKGDHIENRISFGEGEDGNEYNRNIQVADLNCLNAALAVIKFKKLFGYYVDLEGEHFSAYMIDGNHITNEDLNRS